MPTMARLTIAMATVTVVGTRHSSAADIAAIAQLVLVMRPR